MKERPILFNSEMVRAILEDRKTQTRRICDLHKLAKQADWIQLKARISYEKDFKGMLEIYNEAGGSFHKCPYGQVGDRLWVRETLFNDDGDWCYSADSKAILAHPSWRNKNCSKGQIPSIHMPRWASRITLEIVTVRVERLNDISEEDCMNEGLVPSRKIKGYANMPIKNLHLCVQPVLPKFAFKSIWESINGKGSWDKNPWVWVIEFRRINNAIK